MTLTVPNTLGCYKANEAHLYCVSSQPLRPEKVILPEGVHINYTADQWVDMHEEPLRIPMKEVVSKVRQISFEAFLKALEESVKDAQASLKKYYPDGFKSTSHAVVGVELHKSNQWVAELALGNSDFLAANYFRLGEKDARSFHELFDSTSEKALEELKKVFIDKTIVLFDDGSYSGKQLDDHVLGIGKTILTYKIAIKAICVIVPFMTAHAQKKLEKTQAELASQGCELIIAKHSKIDTMDELAEATKQAISDAWYKGAKGLLCTLGLTWFGHKTPNYQSFPKPIANASVFKPDGTPSKAFKGWLVPEITPPYKFDVPKDNGKEKSSTEESCSKRTKKG